MVEVHSTNNYKFASKFALENRPGLFAVKLLEISTFGGRPPQKKKVINGGEIYIYIYIYIIYIKKMI